MVTNSNVYSFNKIIFSQVYHTVNYAIVFCSTCNVRTYTVELQIKDTLKEDKLLN